MKKKEKTVCQIIRFRGKIEAFLVSIDEFATSSYYVRVSTLELVCQSQYVRVSMLELVRQSQVVRVRQLDFEQGKLTDEQH